MIAVAGYFSYMNNNMEDGQVTAEASADAGTVQDTYDISEEDMLAEQEIFTDEGTGEELALVEGTETAAVDAAQSGDVAQMTDGAAAPVSVSAFADGIRDFFEKPDEVLITKQTKKSERVLDIKPLIYGFQVTDRGGVPSFYLKLSTGSTDNLKPELVLEALFLHMGLTYDPNAIQIHRKDVYASDGDDFVSLGAMGEVIE